MNGPYLEIALYLLLRCNTTVAKDIAKGLNTLSETFRFEVSNHAGSCARIIEEEDDHT